MEVSTSTSTTSVSLGARGMRPGTFDQVNLGSLVSLEVGCRRLLEIVESHSRGLDFVDWQKAKHFGGTQNPMELVPAELRAYARRMGRVDDDGRSKRYVAT